jgi:hypothetical protein
VIPTQNTAVVAEAVSFLTSMYRSKPNIRAIVTALLSEAQTLENALYGSYVDRRLSTAVAVVPTPSYGTIATISSSWYEQVVAPLTLPAATYGAATLAISIDMFPGLVFTNPSTFVSTGALAPVPLQSTTKVAVGTVQQPNSVFDAIGALVQQPRGGLDDSDYRSILYLKVAVNKSGGRTTDWSGFGQILLKTSGGPIEYVEGALASFDFIVLDMALSPTVVASVLAGGVPNGVGANLVYSTWAAADTFEVTSAYGGGTLIGEGFGSAYPLPTGTAGGLMTAAQNIA